MEDCVFCKIVSGEVEAFRVYEDNDVLAILDIFPANPGHILILPKNHFSRFEELPDAIIGKMFVLCKYLANQLASLGAKGVNVYLASGEVAGQRAPHIILHLIPRFENDGISFEWERKKVGSNQLQSILEKLKLSNVQKYQTIKKEENIKKAVKKESENKYNKMYEWFKRRKI